MLTSVDIMISLEWDMMNNVFCILGEVIDKIIKLRRELLYGRNIDDFLIQARLDAFLFVLENYVKEYILVSLICSQFAAICILQNSNFITHNYTRESILNAVINTLFCRMYTNSFAPRSNSHQ